MALPRMRLLSEAYKEIKAMDNNTAVTPYYIRTIVLQKKVVCHMAGRRRLINLDSLIEYLQNPDPQDNPAPEQSKIRRLG